MVEKVEKQIVAGWNVFVTFSYPDSADIYEAVVFIPLSYTGDAPQLTSIKKNGVTYEPSTQFPPSTVGPLSTQTTITGGYSSSVDEKNPLFIEAKSVLYKEYPFLSGYDINKIEGQIMSGMNYIFTIVDSKTSDQYVARVYVNLNK